MTNSEAQMKDLNFNSLDFNVVLTDPSGERLSENDIIPTPYDVNNLNSLYWKTEDLANHILGQETNTFFTFEYPKSSRQIQQSN